MHVVCACCDGSLKLYSAKKGKLVFSLGGVVSSWDLSFSDKSDLLVALSRKTLCVIAFGWTSNTVRASSQQLCNAIAAVSSWTAD